MVGWMDGWMVAGGRNGTPAEAVCFGPIHCTHPTDMCHRFPPVVIYMSTFSHIWLDWRNWGIEPPLARPATLSVTETEGRRGSTVRQKLGLDSMKRD